MNRFRYAKNRAYAAGGSGPMYPAAYTWIRNPTPVTTRIITADSGSRAYDQRTENAPPSAAGPIGIHSKRSWVNRGPAPGAPAPRPATAPTERRNDSRTTPQARRATARRDRKRAPNKPLITKPAAGRRGTSQRARSISSPA